MTTVEAESMYRAKFPSVCRFVRRLGAGPELAEEVAQDSFTRILSLPDLATKVITSSYWLRAAQTVYRRRGLHRTESLPVDLCNKVEPEPQALPSFEMLNPREYAAVRCVCSGMTYDQTALSIGTTRTNVTNLKHRGVEKLRLTSNQTGGKVMMSADR